MGWVGVLQWVMLSVGIVGLPNVGKSTLFNALTAGHAEVSNYPFTTIDANVGVVPVPDPRLVELARVLSPEKVTPCAIQFTDIAGLVAGASRGEGLGNQFLAEIRAVDAVAHVVRCFTDADVTHVFGEVDPVRDADVVETELLLADLEIVERAIGRRERDWVSHPRETAGERDLLHLCRERLAAGVPLRALDADVVGAVREAGLGLLTGKPLLYVANVGEDVGEEGRALWEQRLRHDRPGTEAVGLTAKLEGELRQLDADERAEFMAAMGLSEPGLDRLVRAAFRLLGLVTFFTVAKSKLQAWEVRRGTTASQAAGKVHSDMEHGFIRAKVARHSELLAHGSMAALAEHGLVHTVGKEYEVQDGDVVEFLFSPPP
jgi:GTP-binding protein YchF